MNNTIVRTITGIFIILVIIVPMWAVNYSFIFFTTVFSLITFLSLREFHLLLKCNKEADTLIILNALIGVLLFISTSLIIFKGLSKSVLILVWGAHLALMAIELFLKKEKPFLNLAYSILGMFWIALPLSALNILFLPEFYQGDVHIIAMSVFVFLWVNDTGAYVFGLSFGKHRLFERISPKKSWEGFIGGILSVLLAAYIVSFFWKGFGFGEWMLFGLLIAISGTFGDLVESLFKRSINCKDSGRFFPGHGGFLDRFDCVFFAVPAAVAYLLIKNYLGL